MIHLSVCRRSIRHLATTLVALTFFACDGSKMQVAEAEASGSPAGNSAASAATNQPVASTVAFTGTAGPLAAFSNQLADVAEKSTPSVVNISTSKVITRNEMQSPFFNDPFFRHFFGPEHPSIPRERMERSLGSGVIVTAEGIILTNNHVVQGADQIKVTVRDGRELTAEIVGTDPESDLAVLKVKDAPKDLKPIVFGDSNALKLGSVVLAIGNPFGVGQTVTMGIVSAKGRANMGIVAYEDFIQTDAAINPGNSGGALVDLEGRLVGINTAILSRSGGYQGIGFSIPANMAKNIMDSLLKHGKVVRGFLGVMIQDLTPELAKAFNVNETQGVLVSDVVEDSPAAKAGIQTRDIIVSVQGQRMTSSAQLRNYVASLGSGKAIPVEIIRDGSKRAVTVTLGEKNNESGAQPGKSDKDDSLLKGLSVRDLTPDIRQRFEISRRVERGAVVVDLAPGSAAAEAGLRPGDVIVELNRTRVDSAKKFQELYTKSADTVVLRVVRREGSIFLLLKK